jgi:AcrR family transcriptional regulator
MTRTNPRDTGDHRFQISELAARTGVPPTTIHHYRRLGLLPAPARANANRFLYDVRHVRALRLIRALRERRGFRLAVIHRILPDLLRMEEDEAFRPEMWDRAADLRASPRGVPRGPAERLLAAAVAAFAERPVAEVGVDDLCRAAGMAKGSFYRHFRSKEEIFLAAAEAAGGQVAAAFARALPRHPVLDEIVGEDRAAEVLSRALEPMLPIFLELLARAAQRRAGHPPTARRVLLGLTDSVGVVLGTEPARAAGERTLERAMGLLMRQAAAEHPGTEASSLAAGPSGGSPSARVETSVPDRHHGRATTATG